MPNPGPNPGYTANVPQAAQTVAQTQVPINNNFLEINSDFQTDHIGYTNATVADRGKHYEVTLKRQVGAIAPADNNESILFSTISPTINQISCPIYAAGFGATSLNYSLSLSFVVYNINAIVGSADVYDFTGKAPMAGTAIIYFQNFALHVRTLLSPFIWDGTNVYVPGIPPHDSAGAGQLQSSPGTISRFTTNLGNLGGTILQVVSTSPGLCNAIITGTIM